MQRLGQVSNIDYKAVLVLAVGNDVKALHESQGHRFLWQQGQVAEQSGRKRMWRVTLLWV